MIKNKNGKLKKDWIVFYIIMAAIPVVQFCIFYIGVNAKSILFAFQKYDYGLGKYIFNGVENFKAVINNIKLGGSYVSMIKNSFSAYFICLIISVPLALFFSYYIYKKFFASGFFKVMLFLPSILTSLVLVRLFQYMSDSIIPKLVFNVFGAEINGLLSDFSTSFATLLFYSIWTGFGVVVLLYSGAMSGISTSITEAAEIDGVNQLQEFFYVVLPMIYPTLSMFLLTGIAGIFINQLSLFSLYGEHAEPIVWTVGYYLFKEAKSATLADYPYLSSMGLMASAITIALTFVVRYIFNRIDPLKD